jgi:predicted AAA+ superfamily ATPase
METTQNTTLPPEYQGLSFEKVWAMFQETDKRFQETDKKFQETDKEIQETVRLQRQNQKMMSDLGRKFGKIIEHMFIPNLEEKFNVLGYEFGKASSNVLIGNREHNIYTEIDVFLENGDCALAVEVKTQANSDDIREHVERMETLRRYFDLHGDKRKLFGAVAAAIIPGNVRDYALKQGFYVIRQSGDTVSIEEPRGKAHVW